MNGLSGNLDWDDTEERGGWYRASSALLLLAAGVSSASLWVASWLFAAPCLAIRMNDRADRHTGEYL